MVMPLGGNGAAVLLSRSLGAAPPPRPFCLRQGDYRTVAFPRERPSWGQAGGHMGHLGSQALS